MVQRILEQQIESSLFKGKIIILYGPRQVGKTTMVKNIVKSYPNSKYFLCESPDVAENLTGKTAKQMVGFFGEKTKLVILDEAQSINNIGKSLKLLIDTYPDLQLIVTGSSSFDLASSLNEPLTGRYIDYFMYPFSISELSIEYNDWELRNLLDKILITGLYPEVFLTGSPENQKILGRISESYLFKDILKLDKIKSSSKLKKLLQALALQVGSEVSLNELGNLANLDKNTVERYISILQKAFIIFELPALSRNLRKEISKSKKYYFYDLGVRNSLIKNFNTLGLRSDIGAIWENFCILEKLKYNSYHGILANYYFWRTYDQQEIDLIEERDGIFFASEFKWNQRKKPRVPNSFASAYPQHEFKVIDSNNWLEFIKL